MFIFNVFLLHQPFPFLKYVFTLTSVFFRTFFVHLYLVGYFTVVCHFSRCLCVDSIFCLAKIWRQEERAGACWLAVYSLPSRSGLELGLSTGILPDLFVRIELRLKVEDCRSTVVQGSFMLLVCYGSSVALVDVS